MPGGVNLNLYSGGKACIPRHSDNEPLFGGGGDSKLIVSVSFGATATFRWARNSDRDRSSGWSQRLSHGDILVMDGKAQDQFEHWTEAGVQEERISLTYRWIKQHNPGCVSATTGVLCCLPSCAEGLSVHRTPGGLWEGFFPWLGLVLALLGVVVGCWWFSSYSPCPSSFGARGGCCRRACPLDGSLWHYFLRVPKGLYRIRPKEKFGGLGAFSGSGTHESVMGSPPFLAMMWVPLFWYMGQYEGIAGKMQHKSFFSPLLGFSW